MSDDTKCSQQVRNAAATRQSILDSARRQFARDSYENVGVRDIAGEAGVDPALVVRYFGGKEQLFREVLDSGRPDAFWDGVDIRTLPTHLASLVMSPETDFGGTEAKIERLLIILRSASSSQASVIVQDAIDEFILAPIAMILDAPDGRLRACLALTILMGSGIFQQIQTAKPICDAGDAALQHRLVRLFEAALEST